MNVLYLVLIVLAAVCFLLAAWGVPAQPYRNLTALGLLFWLASTLIRAMPLR